MEENEVLEFDLNHNSKGEVSSSLKVSAVLSWIMAGLMILISGYYATIKRGQWKNLLRSLQNNLMLSS